MVKLGFLLHLSLPKTMCLISKPRGFSEVVGIVQGNLDVKIKKQRRRGTEKQRNEKTYPEEVWGQACVWGETRWGRGWQWGKGLKRVVSLLFSNAGLGHD